MKGPRLSIFCIYSFLIFIHLFFRFLFYTHLSYPSVYYWILSIFFFWKRSPIFLVFNSFQDSDSLQNTCFCHLFIFINLEKWQSRFQPTVLRFFTYSFFSQFSHLLTFFPSKFPDLNPRQPAFPTVLPQYFFFFYLSLLLFYYSRFNINVAPIANGFVECWLRHCIELWRFRRCRYWKLAIARSQAIRGAHVTSAWLPTWNRRKRPLVAPTRRFHGVVNCLWKKSCISERHCTVLDIAKGKLTLLMSISKKKMSFISVKSDFDILPILFFLHFFLKLNFERVHLFLCFLFPPNYFNHNLFPTMIYLPCFFVVLFLFFSLPHFLPTDEITFNVFTSLLQLVILLLIFKCTLIIHKPILWSAMFISIRMIQVQD